MPYNFTSLPEVQTVDELRQHLTEELQRISQSMNDATELELRGSRHEPDRPREGMIVHADGTSWNPGGGQGTYRYQNGLWVKIGSASSGADIGSLFGFGRVVVIGSTPLSIVRAQSGTFFININANRTINLPLASGNGGVNFAFYTVDLGGGGNLTITAAGSDVIFLPDGTNPASITLTTRQEIILVTEGGNWFAYAANFRGAFPQGNGILWDSTSLRTVQQMSVTADGSGLKLSGDAASPGNSQYYGTDSGGTKGFFGLPASGGLTLITSVAAPAAATWTITGLSGYKVLWPSFRNIQQSSGTARIFQVELSGNNGSSFSAQIHQPTNGTAFATATPEVINFWVTRADQANNQMIFLHTFTAPAGNNLIDSTSVGPINALRFSWSGAATNFTGGDVDIYGLK